MDKLNPKIIPAFSNPIFIFDLPYDDQFKTGLINQCIKLRNENQTINSRFSHLHVGWQSNNFLFKTELPYLKEISKNIIDSLILSTKNFSPNLDISKYIINADGWINVNETNTLHFPHLHNGATLSGVFYVQVPKSSENTSSDPKKSGLIEFLDPRNSVNQFARGNKELECSIPFIERMIFQPKEGQLLIFPAWLKHWVYPNYNNLERISISFNASFIPN